jgi:hypothetical protein
MINGRPRVLAGRVASEALVEADASGQPECVLCASLAREDAGAPIVGPLIRISY